MISRHLDLGHDDASAPVGSRRRAPRIAGVLYLAALHAVCAALLFEPNAVQRARTFWYRDPSLKARYQGSVTAHKAICAGMPEQSVVFLGDSRVLWLPVNETMDGPTINLGVGGDTIRALQSRMAQYPRLATARRLVVGIGINDLSHIPDSVLIEEYRGLLASLRATGPKLTALAIYPIDERRYTGTNSELVSGHRVTNARIRAVNERMREECRRSGVDYVDVNAALIGEDGNLKPELSDDGLHLNPAGGRAWAGALRPRFTELERPE